MNGYLILSGSSVLREAISDWKEVGGDKPFSDWFPASKWIKSHQKYLVSPGLSDIKEYKSSDKK